MPESSFTASTARQGRSGAGAGRGDKRARILKGAIQVFAKKGFYTARVSDIARAAGVADGTIYLYFKNKDDILISLFEERFDTLITTLTTELPAIDGALPRLRHMVELQLGTMEKHRDLAEVLTVNLRQSTRLLRQYAAPRFNKYLEVMAGVVAEGQRDGTLRADVSPSVVARMIFGAIDGLALTWALGASTPGELSRAAAQLGDVLARGLGA